jgi:hypothetical protein
MAVACAGLLATCGDDEAAPIPPRYTITLAVPATAGEGDGPVACVIDIAPAPDAGTTIDIALASDDAAAAVPNTVTVTGAGTAGFNTTVRAANATYEGDVGATITATGPDCSPDLAMIAVTDDEVGTVIVTIPSASATEGDADLTTCTVNVFPAPTGSDTVDVGIVVNSGYIVPLDATVTVGSSGPAAFGLSFRADNDVYEPDSHATVTGSSPAYESGTDTITLTDNELGAVNITVPDSATEGDAGVQGTIDIFAPGVADGADVSVSLNSTDTSAADVPATVAVTITAGTGNGIFGITIRPENITVEPGALVTITGSSTGYEEGSEAITVYDND